VGFGVADPDRTHWIAGVFIPPFGVVACKMQLREQSIMSARLLVSLVAVAGFMAAGCLNAGAEDATDGIKSRPAAADAQKYRPKHGCFATGTRDGAGNTQMVCR
jgi:hypothetical protein